MSSQTTAAIRSKCTIAASFFFTFRSSEKRPGTCNNPTAHRIVRGRLTVEDHGNAEKARYARADESDATGPSATHRSAVHHQNRHDVSGDLERSRQERVEVDVAVKCSGVERQRVVDQTARCPACMSVKMRTQRRN